MGMGGGNKSTTNQSQNHFVLYFYPGSEPWLTPEMGMGGFWVFTKISKNNICLNIFYILLFILYIFVYFVYFIFCIFCIFVYFVYHIYIYIPYIYIYVYIVSLHDWWNMGTWVGSHEDLREYVRKDIRKHLRNDLRKDIRHVASARRALGSARRTAKAPQREGFYGCVCEGLCECLFEWWESIYI